MKHLPAHPDADQCTLSPRPAGHSLTPTTPARSSRSTREHPATIAWGHARPERRGHAFIHVYDLTCSPAPRDSTSKQQTTPAEAEGECTNQAISSTATLLLLLCGCRLVAVVSLLAGAYKNSRNGLQLDHRSANDDRGSTGDFVGIRAVRAAIVGRHCTRRSRLPQLALSWWRYCPRIAADTQRLATALTLRMGVRVARHAGSTEHTCHLAPHAAGWAGWAVLSACLSVLSQQAHA